MKVIKTKSTLNNLHWYSGTKHCLKDYQDAWFFVTVSEVISLKYSLGLVSNKSLEIMPEPGGRRSGSQEHDYRVSVQPPWALQDPVSKTTWNKEETNKGKSW